MYRDILLEKYYIYIYKFPSTFNTTIQLVIRLEHTSVILNQIRSRSSYEKIVKVSWKWPFSHKGRERKRENGLMDGSAANASRLRIDPGLMMRAHVFRGRVRGCVAIGV